MIPQEAIEAVHAAICEESLAGHLDPDWRGRCVKAVEAAAPFLRAQALEDAADALVWVRPEKSPCDAVEACCGSEASCDAMNRSASAVGETWLRTRAATERGL